nr:DNA-directed RNA polymerase subunit beta' [Ardenticatena maritima]
MEIKNFKAIRISLASPEEIRSWSYGEVTKPETINYRRLRPERDGLFCEAIFGPTRDWQCYCGKYKKVRFKGIVCDKCGVEVTRSSVRRERMGHIELAAPVAHIWYTRRVPSYLGLLLDISRRHLDRVLYFAQYIVTHVDEEARQKALERIDQVVDREVETWRHQAAEQIASLEAAAKARIDEIRNELHAALKALEAKRDERVNELMSAASELRDYLNINKGKQAPQDLVFAPTGTTIVAKGEVIENEHITELNTLVEEQLNKVQAVFEQEKGDKEALAASQIDEINAELAQRKQDISDDLARRIQQVSAQHDDERDELRNLKVGMFLNEIEYRNLYVKYGDIFRAGMGAEALLEIIQNLNLDEMAKELRLEIRRTKSKQRRKKATKRLKIVEAFRQSGNKPEWMILRVLPVIPPELRPMVQLGGGRFATSDLNDLYRRVINRNNRLKRLLELEAPDVIIRNEKRMLQEAVDSLIDNSRRGKAVSLRGKRKLKSLSDMLKGKQGRFRRNLLGKRVDYSGRSVIVVGPHLKLHQCGLPKKMALELFKPFVIHKLVEENYAANVKGAKRIIEQMRPEVWGILEKVIQGRPVLLNRAPTLHRLGIQAFEPILIEGDAIQLHPLVCPAFNADFDGDQMAVHVPLSEKAVKEAYELMLSSRNLLKPADGEPTVSPTKDMVLGLYYLTMPPDESKKGAGRIFASPDEAIYAYDIGELHLHAPIKVRIPRPFDGKPLSTLATLPERVRTLLEDAGYTDLGDVVDTLKQSKSRLLDIPGFGRAALRDLEEALAEAHIDPENFPLRNELVETTVGQLIVWETTPPELGFKNRLLDKGGVRELVSEVYTEFGMEKTAEFADALKDLGFKYATKSGTTIAIDDVTVPPEKQKILAEIEKQVEEVERQYRRGLITSEEQYRKTVELWSKAKEDISEAVQRHMDPRSPIAVMANSGATKGGFTTVAQLAGMRGLMADPSGRIIALPIRSNFREGLNALEYFISTHGSRKGLADTALRTADAGYLTRRLVDVAQDVIVRAEDCGTREGIRITAEDSRLMQEKMYERIVGRFTLDPIAHPETGEIIVGADELITERKARAIIDAGITEVYVRSPLGCRLRKGVCVKCYGRDMGRGGLIPLGEAVGVIAAQSIGEPGTQLTLRTFHTGGVAGASDITQGLPRVQELFEARVPKGESPLAEIGGRVEIEDDGDMRIVRIINATQVRETITVPEGYTVLVDEGDIVNQGDVLATGPEGEEIAAPKKGVVLFEDEQIVLVSEEKETREYAIPPTARLRVRAGQIIEPGYQLTEGAKDPHKVLRIQGREAVQQYLLQEVQRVYRSQGVSIHDKHIEIIIRQMLRKVRIKKAGDTKYLPGDLVDRLELEEVNQRLRERGLQPAVAEQVLLGITKAALNTESFLSAASFQHTITVLAQAAIEGRVDPLEGLKENVILGKLIPAGTGFRPEHREDEAEIEQKIRTEKFAEEEELEEIEFDDEELEEEEEEFDLDELADIADLDELLEEEDLEEEEEEEEEEIEEEGEEEDEEEEEEEEIAEVLDELIEDIEIEEIEIDEDLPLEDLDEEIELDEEEDLEESLDELADEEFEADEAEDDEF